MRRAAAILAAAQGSPFIHAARLAGLRSGTTVADLAELAEPFNQLSTFAVEARASALVSEKGWHADIELKAA